MNETILSTMAARLRPAARNRYIIYLALFLGVIFTVPGVTANIANASPVVGFNAGRIIDDGVFTNANSMNAGQIQTFLNSKVPTCETWHAPGYGQNPPFTCLKDFSENGRSAAQIIYDTAQQYQINPQVLIVLLQKEQGLVTDTWPLNTQYRTATGYGCPDTAACDSQYYGLTNQIQWSGKMFRSIMNNSPTWYTPYILGNNYIKYNPNSSCGGSTVNIVNRSTQALYNYTPYQPNQSALNAGYGTGDSCGAYGNRNFYLYFTDWFGSVRFSQPIGASLYYQQSTKKIYLVNDSTRYYISSWQTMTNYGLDAFQTSSASDASINSLTDGGTLTNLIWDSGGVYLVNSGVRHHVSGDMCTAWGLSCFDGAVVKPLNSTFQTQYLRQGGDLTNISNINGVLYKMSSGLRLPVANSKTLSDLGLATTPQLSTSPSNSNQTLGPLLITTPGILHFSGNSPLYYFGGSTYFKIEDTNSYNDWALNRIPWLSVPGSSYDQTLPLSTTLSPWAIVNGNKFIVDQGQSLLIPAELTNLWGNTQFTAPPSALFAGLATNTLTPIVWSSPNIYLIESGKKHYIPTYDDFVGIKASLNTSVTSLRPDKLSTVQEGNNALSEGKLVSVDDGSGKVYVVNNHKLTYIPGPDVFNAYGYDWGKIYNYPSAITSDYPIDGTILGSGINIDGLHFITSGPVGYYLSSGLSVDFGTIDSKFVSIGKQTIKSGLARSFSRFLYNSDSGRIYYASGGAIHYVATYSAFVAYGGARTPTTSVNTTTLSLFTEAQPVY